MFLYRKAVQVVGVADSTLGLLTEKGISAEKISIIKNGVDLELFDNQINGQTIKHELTSKKNFMVSYIGTHGLSHALDSVLKAANILSDQSDIHFVFIGEGAEKKRLILQSEKMSLNNVLFLDQIIKEDLPKYYAASDVVLVSLRDLPLFKCVIPSKIFEIMAMGKPILISINGESKKLVVEEANAGVAVAPENPEQLAAEILRLYNNRNLGYELGKNGRKFVELKFDRNKLADKYLILIEKVLKRETLNTLM
jgi:glycosyltransferase involved in cell wall biosynthesis